MDKESETEMDRLAALQRYNVLDTAPEESFDRITRLTKTALRVPIALISLVDANRQWFKSRQGLDAEETARDISFCTHAIRRCEPLIVPNALEDERFRDNPLVLGPPNIRFYAGIPLTTPDGHNIGTLCAIDDQPRDISEEEINILRDFARIVIDELELRRIALTDSLTGAETRRSFELSAGRELNRARRYGHALSVITMDIDHFKAVNDSFGHQTGDVVLTAFAALCKSGARTIDSFARLGGEEFALLLPETGQDGAVILAERLREKVAETPVFDCGKRVDITASFGVAELHGGDESIDHLLGRADRALYAAKNGGATKWSFCPAGTTTWRPRPEAVAKTSRPLDSRSPQE